MDAHSDSRHMGLFTEIRQRSTWMHTHARADTQTQALSLSYLLSINQISAYLCNLTTGSRRSVLRAHCRDCHCQPTAPTLMTSSLCTIHRSRTRPSATTIVLNGKYMALRYTTCIDNSIQYKVLYKGLWKQSNCSCTFIIS